MLKICFNGWFSGFIDKTNPGITVDFFIDLFEKVYEEKCEIGNLNDSDILCEFDMLLDCSGTLIKYKKWKNTYLFNGESTMRCNPNNYDIVLWGERNYKNIVNVPLFIPYIYINNLVDKLTEIKNITNVPENDVCVIISNPGGQIRNTFLHKLDENFKVTYAGSYKNNIGGNIPYAYNTSEFINFVRRFKFIISMENSRNDTYITEKIIHGLIANTIPVYWGSKRISEYFNSNRFLNVDDENSVNFIIDKMKEISGNNQKWLGIVNQINFIDNKLERNIYEIAKDIKCLINKEPISRIYCVNNPIFEPDRHLMLKNMFSKLNINDNYVKYISPTYKTTITKDVYDKYTSKQLVRYLRSHNMSIAELSLFLNYKAVLTNIVKNYKDGLFLILESDVMANKDVGKLNKFIDFIKDKDFDLIHIGSFTDEIFKYPYNEDMITGYRTQRSEIQDLIRFKNGYSKNGIWVEDITDENDEFRVIRKFHTRCTDSFLWKYKGIVRFLDFMEKFEDYSVPFDYYMCNFFEKNIDFKHYWSVNEFFQQGSNLGITQSTIR